jgi:hypothetical protein
LKSLGLALGFTLIVLAQGLSDKTKPSKEYVHLNGRVIATRVCPSCPTVQLIDTTHPGTTHFKVGDSYTLKVKGAGGQPVTVTIPPGSPYTFANTDTNGNWSTSGTWVAGNAGAYTEYWTVGGIPAMPTVIFTVYTN